MRLFNRDNLKILLLCCILIWQVVISFREEKPQINLKQEIELFKIKQERELLQKAINEKQLQIKSFQDEIIKIKNDITIDTATANQLEQFLSEYAKSKR